MHFPTPAWIHFPQWQQRQLTTSETKPGVHLMSFLSIFQTTLEVTIILNSTLLMLAFYSFQPQPIWPFHNAFTTDMLALQSILFLSAVNVTLISSRNAKHSSWSEKPNSGTKNSTGRVGRYLFTWMVVVKWMKDQQTSNEKENKWKSVNNSARQ